MRRWIAHLLQRLAVRIYNDERKDLLIMTDEYDITRCRVEVLADDFHGVEAEFDELPNGWHVHAWKGDEQYK